MINWSKVAPQYQWLNTDLGGPLPTMIAAALADYGLMEGAGSANNPVIMGWRNEVAKAGGDVAAYTADAVPWCGLAMAHWAVQAGKTPPRFPLFSLNWAHWGRPGGQPCLGDVLTFTRTGGGHVTLYVGEDRLGYYHCLGGNQANGVNIERIAKNRLYHVVRPPIKTADSKAARPYILDAVGDVSTNEA